VVRGGDGIDEPVEDPAILEPARFADRLDPFDPAVAAVRLGATLELAHQHGVAYSAFGCVVGGVYVEVGNVAEGPQRVVLVQQPSGEVGGPFVLAGGALLKQRADLLAQRRQLLG